MSECLWILPLVAWFAIPASLKAGSTTESASADATNTFDLARLQTLGAIQQDHEQKAADDQRLLKLRDQFMGGRELSQEDRTWVQAKLGPRIPEILAANGADSLPSLLQRVEEVADRLNKKQAVSDDDIADASDSCANTIALLNRNLDVYKNVRTSIPQAAQDMKICELEFTFGLSRERFLAAQKTLAAAPVAAEAKPIEPTAVTSANYDTEVARSKIPVFIDYYATWCGPCQRMAPIIAAMAGRYAGKVKFVKIDVDQGRDLAIKAGISAMPTFLMLRNEREIWRQVGTSPRSELSSAISKALSQ